MKATYCDHCAKLVLHSMGVDEDLVENIDRYSLLKGECPAKSVLTVDLCDSCYEEFKTFLEIGKEKVLTEFNSKKEVEK